MTAEILSAPDPASLEKQPTSSPSSTICITGNIASGKTTLARLLASNFQSACYIPEPDLENPFLSLYLKDQPRWGFVAQLRYFWEYTRVYQEITRQQACHYRLVDTGTWTNRLVYAQYLCDEHIITADEYTFYQTLCDTILRAYQIPDPACYIFVQASPEQCWQRMIERGWSYQTTTVDLAYIQALDRYVLRMKQTVSAAGKPVLNLSSEMLDFRTESGQREAFHQVESFLQTHHI
jgi:deoxyadenosine/deoxycytidine kinase